MRKKIGRENKDLGEIRTSQLITSYGVGAIVDFKNETAILGGADDWFSLTDGNEERILHCHNLEKILDKEFFVKPKYDNKNKAFYKRKVSHDIGAYRFPKVLYCPNCMHLWKDDQSSGSQNSELLCPNCRNRLVPSRFVVVCRHGHISDFPYSQWVHHGEFCENNPDGHSPNLKLFNVNGKANLGSLMVSCEDCGKIRNMQEAFVPGTLAAIYKCEGNQPWLNQKAHQFCSEKAEVRMRSATGVYMPVNISAINIPPWSSKINKILLKHLDALEGKSEKALISYIQRKILPLLPNTKIAQVLESYKFIISDKNMNHPSSLQELYEDEFCALCTESEDLDADFSSRHAEIPDKYRQLIDSISALDRLTEIVAMIGFTRLQSWDGDLKSPCLAPIFSDTRKEWLPAIDTHGEGIFIKFNETKVAAWEQKNQHIYSTMMDQIKANHIFCENASARYVLLHTIAHLFIRSLSNMCGYPTSSLKERIYSTYPDGKPMAGILIYTASPDTEGSLGGLVAQAQKSHIEENFDALLNEAEWCSGDPLCMTSTGGNGQGVSGLNYAACHQCTLLPETSCTMRNLLLDRAALVGRVEDGTVGFFKV